MSISATPIERVKELHKADFIEKYFKPQKPVVLENAVADWPMRDKWTLDYFKKIAGHKIVPLYNSEPVDANQKVNEPDMHMRLSEYIDLLKRQPTDLRIFLYNLLKEIPEMRSHYTQNDLGVKVLNHVPMLFFGGRNASVFMHYDIDYGNLFHYHLEGNKQCLLAAPSETPFLYKIPYAWISHEGINFSQPDLEKWPAIKNVSFLSAELLAGDMLYIPEGYWHYMTYHSAGFSLTLRALPRKPSHIIKALYNIFWVRFFDNTMRSLLKQDWIEYKNKWAIRQTKKNLAKSLKFPS